MNTGPLAPRRFGAVPTGTDTPPVASADGRHDLDTETHRVVHRPGGEKSSIGAKFCSPRPRTEGAAELAMLA
jgi:hypothetical protein